jgi:hypothetical protein
MKSVSMILLMFSMIFYMFCLVMGPSKAGKPFWDKLTNVWFWVLVVLLILNAVMLCTQDYNG